MVRATLIYYQRVGDFIGYHDEDGDMDRKWSDATNKRTKMPYDSLDLIEVIEYWDGKNFLLFAEGDLAKKGEHDYGRPPFVYTLAPFGAPAYTRTPSLSRNVLEAGQIVQSVELDIADRGLSFFHNRFETHAQREALLGKAATMASAWGDEALFIEQDDMAYKGDPPDISRAKGARNRLRSQHEKLVPDPTSQMPPSVQFLMAQSQEDNSRGGLPPQDYGLTPSAQQSGYSIAGLSSQSQKKLAGVRGTIESHLAGAGELMLMQFRDFGHDLGEEGRRGLLEIPMMYASPNQEPDDWWTVTPEMIDRTGWKVNVKLVDTPDPQTLGMLMNGLHMARADGLITPEQEIQLAGLPGARNPTQTVKDVRVSKLKELPQYQLAELYRYAKEELQDPVLANVIGFLISQQGMQQGGQPGGGMGGPQGAPQPGGPPSPTPGGPTGAGTPGMSMPALGRNTGTAGGRPPAMPPPGTVGPPTER